MKTDDLILMLSTDVEAVPANVIGRRFALAIAGGAIGSFLLLISTMNLLGDLLAAFYSPKFLIKLGFVACLAAASLLATIRLSKPGFSLGHVAEAIVFPVFLIWGLAAITLAQTQPAEGIQMIFGQTWKVCAALITLLSIPSFIAVMWAVKGLAPTNLRLAGFAAGLLSGTIATLIYCLHCPEMEAPFLAVWYVLGMLVPAGFGALLGPRFLRW